MGPGGEESFGYQQIMPMMHGLEPEKVAGAGDAFANLAGKLESLRDALTAAADHAGQSWRGKAAAAAMAKIQQLHDQTAQLAAQSRTAGNTLSWLGGEVMPQYKAIPAPQVESGLMQDLSTGIQATTVEGLSNLVVNGAPDGSAKANSAAQDYLRTFNQHLATANNAMPKNLSAPGNFGAYQNANWAPSAGNHSGPGNGGGTGGSGYGGLGGPSGAGGGGVPGYSAPSANPFHPGKLPGGGPSASLQGYAPPSSGSAPVSPFGAGSPGGMASGGGSANPFARMGVMPGGAGGGLPGAGSLGKGLPGASLPGEGLPGEGSVAPGAAGSASADGAAGAAGAEAAGAAGAEGGGMTGMPMAGGGAGQQEKERQRQAWMEEDDSIWGMPDTTMGPIIE